MAVIYPQFLRTILNVYDNIQNQLCYPFFDEACTRYEALRAVLLEEEAIPSVIAKFGLTEYAYRQCLVPFEKYGVAGLIGLTSHQLTESLSTEVERMVFVLKKARPWIPATKMVLIIKGFNHNVDLATMRHLYASYGWAHGTKPYKNVDFYALNLKVIGLCQQQSQPLQRKEFLHKNDPLQNRLEIFRTLGQRGITKRYSGSRVSFENHKRQFLSLGLLGLLECARPPFRNSKLGFAEEGKIILSKIQHPEKDEAHYVKILASKKISVGPTCLINIFNRWRVFEFRSQFVGDLQRLLAPEDYQQVEPKTTDLPEIHPLRLDKGFIRFIINLRSQPISLAHPGIFIFLPYLNQLKIFEKMASLMTLDPDQGYSVFSLLILNLGRIFEGISSISKACRTHEVSLPLSAGLVTMPSNDALLNGLATIDQSTLYKLRTYLTQVAKQQSLIQGKRIAFDFKMRDFTGDDVNLKNIGKGPSPQRKLCFPGFRPHLAWDVSTGCPISLEFRNGKARAPTTIKRFINELLVDSLGQKAVEHVYVDSEYTAEHLWAFIVDPKDGLGAHLTMCIKRNKKVKKFIEAFLKSNPSWLFYDEDHTYSKQNFSIPIQQTNQHLYCVLKRKEATGALRCFGSTLKGLTSKQILDEYRTRWIIENGIKDLTQNYYFNDIPGINPHRINIHYFIVTLARILYQMMSRDYNLAFNSDQTQKGLDSLRREFITGTNSIISRENNTLLIKWTDPYPKEHHEAIRSLFNKLNLKAKNGLPFLGGLHLRFDIVSPKSENFCNKFKREHLVL